MVSKKHRLTQIFTMADNMDMFSKLPNDLICIIISSLPFKEAAKTSILSGRWRHIWHATKKIELLESFFVRPGEYEENKELHRRQFINFVHQWIGNCDALNVNTFRLEFSRPGTHVEDIYNCITFVISHNVKELALDFHDPVWQETDIQNHPAVFDLPEHVYSHNELESLELFSCNFSVSKLSNFIALKQISLGWIELSMPSMRDLLQHCPLLESLSLKKCWNIEQLEITVPNLRLKRLVIDKCNFIRDWFQIEAPNLRFFKYSGSLGRFVFDKHDFLAEAELDFALELEFDEDGELLYELLQRLEHVKVLTVCSYLLQVVPHVEEPLGTTIPLNVDHLILNTVMHSNEYFGINFMLNSCPHLTTLTINIGPGTVFPDYTPPIQFNPNECWKRNFVVYSCILTSLKVVNVKGFKGRTIEAYFLRYLIFFGLVMEEMNIYLSDEADANGGNREVYMQRAQLVQQFRRCSRHLRISIY